MILYIMMNGSGSSSASTNPMKEYICANVSKLNKKEKIFIGQIISDTPNLIKECAEGCIIDLNKLNDGKIKDIFGYIKNRLEH